jgi:hypothetical protein
LRFFGGLSVDESAAVLEISPETVMRDWKFARSWLQAELSRIKQLVSRNLQLVPVFSLGLRLETEGGQKPLPSSH